MDKKTCTRCRAKKIRCDGQTPCRSCSRARAEVECDYTTPNSSHPPELRKGAACTACRRKKKRCSGTWPCQTCIASKKEDECKFDDGSQLSFTRALIERTLELEQLLTRAKHTPFYPVNAELSAELDQLLLSRSFVDPELQDSLLNDLAGTLQKNVDQYATAEFADPIIPSPSPVPDSLEEKSRLRRLFLQKRMQFGFTLPPAKINALMAGDLSGDDVHPALVHLCHLWGYMFDNYERNHSWAYAVGRNCDEAAQMRLVLGALNGLEGTIPDPVTTLVAYTSLSLYYFHKGDVDQGQEFLGVASNAILTQDLDLKAVAYATTSEGGHQGILSLDPLSDVDQLRAAFSHCIYTGLAAQAVLATPSVFDPRLTDKFDLLMNTQVHSNLDINFLRAKSLRLLNQTRSLSPKWRQNGGTPPAAWFEEYWKLVEHLNNHLGTLDPLTFRVSFLPDAHSVELCLKLSTIMALAALAELHGIFAPSHVESSRRYRDTVVEIVSISSTFTMDDCHYLDPILALCWSVATKRILTNQVVYDNQDSIIRAIRTCNDNLRQALPFVIDFQAKALSL
ncbi:hypothetical protein FB45DRAFT_314084 [Roridomyces roridus]|uniref:Zn(2)-C6 fungal-type domain-containing protein n=1 Tax=Roridomyces roridus TaxID=1738132 RepID=A0AAD7FCZ2_9AGAR|nr:hypothetical protein FB45DRAFT_314084 [Roridomyces roridus]